MSPLAVSPPRASFTRPANHSAIEPAAPRLRVGGMAFGNGVLMRSQRFWAWARADGTILEGPVRTLLDRHRWLRLPLLRSAVAFFEMIALSVRLHRENGLRLNARLLLWLALCLLAGQWLSQVLPQLIHSELLASALLQFVCIALGLLALRQGMGEQVWRYHGAEHKAVNAYEAGDDLYDTAAVMSYSRVHDRCGTNLVVIVFVFMLGYLPLGDHAFAGIFSVFYAVIAIAVSLELFRLISRRPRSLLSRTVLFGGKTIQRCLTTREPQREQLELACAALRRVVELEGRAECRRPKERFLRRAAGRQSDEQAEPRRADHRHLVDRRGAVHAGRRR